MCVSSCPVEGGMLGTSFPDFLAAKTLNIKQIWLNEALARLWRAEVSCSSSAWLFWSWDIYLFLLLDLNLGWNLHQKFFYFSSLWMKVDLCYQLSWVSSLMTADLGLPRFHNHVSLFLVLYVSVYICIYIQYIFIYTIFIICCIYYKMKYIIFESVSHSFLSDSLQPHGL